MLKFYLIIQDHFNWTDVTFENQAKQRNEQENELLCGIENLSLLYLSISKF